jgi:hypothetical protein
MDLYSSIGSLSQINLKNISTTGSIIRVDQATDFSISDSIITNIQSGNGLPISILRSEVSFIDNFTLHDMTQTPLNFKTTNIGQITNLNVTNCTHHLLFELSNVTLISSSYFDTIGSTDMLKGGSIYTLNTNLSISESNFINNKAVKGAAIYFSCTGNDRCDLDLSDSSFTNNVASQSGGAIQYDVYRPSMQNNTFTNNTAIYGPNIASYAIKIIEESTGVDQIKLENIGSGIEETVSLTLGLYDHDDQIMILDSSSPIEIKAIEADTAVLGTTVYTVNEGVTVIDTLIFEAQPGTAIVNYSLNSDAIDMTVMNKQYEPDYKLEDVLVNFRFCKPGEIETGMICSP